MTATDDSGETSIFDLDWAALSESQKSAIIVEHVKLIDVSRRATRASGAHISNIRSLFLMMIVALAMGLQNFDNKTIILTMISFQLLKSLSTRLIEVRLHSLVEKAKQELAKFMMRHARRE